MKNPLLVIRIDIAESPCFNYFQIDFTIGVYGRQSIASASFIDVFALVNSNYTPIISQTWVFENGSFAPSAKLGGEKGYSVVCVPGYFCGGL